MTFIRNIWYAAGWSGELGRTLLARKILNEKLGPGWPRNAAVMHASIRVGTSYLMLHDEMAGSKSPRAYGGSPVELFLYVDDCDAVFKRAVDAGADGKVKPSDQFWGDRWGVFTDPFGLSWSVATHKEDLTKDEIESRQSEFFAEMAGKSG